MKTNQTYLDTLQETIRNIRRDLHKIPEVGLQEKKTAAYIKKTLTQWGITHFETWLETGVVVVMKGNQDAPAVAFRADIDALPVTEQTDCSFASCHTGYMHACGHDGHIAMLLGFAKYLKDHPQCLVGDVVLIFQPAEERPGGARLLVEAGLFEQHPVCAIIGCHIFPQFLQGQIACRKGALMARNGEVDIHVFGTAAHGAMPHLGNDALLAASAIATGLHSIISRNISPLDGGVLTFGKIQGGEACNIIAKEVKLEGTLRAFTDDAYETITKRIQTLASNIAEAYGCRAEVVFRHMYRVVENDATLVDYLQEVAGEQYQETEPYMLSEDFSLYLQCVKGLFFFLGRGNPEKGYTYPLHHAKFQFDETILLDGVLLYAKLLQKIQQTI